MKRYAVFFAPRPGDFATRAAHWLGRDTDMGVDLAQPVLTGLPLPAVQITESPRRYGFHGTIRAPFRPATGLHHSAIADAVAAIAAGHGPVICGGLRLEYLHGFLALIPTGDEPALLALAAAVVEATDPLRAPLTPDEIARRRPESLTPRQRELLHFWGYPYVMEEFRFHLTLTDRLPADQVGATMAVLNAHFAPVLPKPFVIEDLCLLGEDDQGLFHLIHRYALTG